MKQQEQRRNTPGEMAVRWFVKEMEKSNESHETDKVTLWLSCIAALVDEAMAARDLIDIQYDEKDGHPYVTSIARPEAYAPYRYFASRDYTDGALREYRTSTEVLRWGDIKMHPLDEEE